MLFNNNKTQKTYRHLYEATDCTNDRDGTAVVVYKLDDSTCKLIFIRELKEFYKKFSFVDFETFEEEELYKSSEVELIRAKYGYSEEEWFELEMRSLPEFKPHDNTDEAKSESFKEQQRKAGPPYNDDNIC